MVLREVIDKMRILVNQYDEAVKNCDLSGLTDTYSDVKNLLKNKNLLDNTNLLKEEGHKNLLFWKDDCEDYGLPVPQTEDEYYENLGLMQNHSNITGYMG